MHRIVANCFKSIAFAIIFVIVWDVCFYLWRVNALNQRMESIGVSMQEVVSKNNYLPDGDMNMFKSLLLSICDDMNGSDDFIKGINWNYNHSSNYQPKILDSDGNNIVRYTMANPADYGDVMVIELQVGVNSTVWTQKDVGSKGNSADTFVKDVNGIVLTYTYMVPCLKYNTVTSR